EDITQAEFNTAYVAHIISSDPNGPRGDKVLSAKLRNDITNLMLMCDPHHRLIDVEQLDQHPTERLHAMKRRHEERMELLTSINEDKQSQILLYGANIDKHTNQINFKDAALAMTPEWYPASRHPIELSLKNSSFQDRDDLFWKIEEQQLNTLFN